MGGVILLPPGAILEFPPDVTTLPGGAIVILLEDYRTSGQAPKAQQGLNPAALLVIPIPPVGIADVYWRWEVAVATSLYYQVAGRIDQPYQPSNQLGR